MGVSEYFRRDSRFYGDGYRQGSRHCGDQSNARWNYGCWVTNGVRGNLISNLRRYMTRKTSGIRLDEAIHRGRRRLHHLGGTDHG